MHRILVVDDSRMDQQIAKGLLEQHSDQWEIVTAEDGVAGLELHQQQPADLVITDLQMPRMNGLELVEAIKACSPTTPVILMTAAGSEEIAVEALAKGAASYVPKKELARDLGETVRRILAASSADEDRRRLQQHLTELQYELDNDMELLSALVRETRELIQQRKLLPENDCVRLATAFDEALSNAFYHGNLEISSEVRDHDANAFYSLAEQRRREEPYRQRRIRVTISLAGGEILITIKDDGRGFDPTSLPDPTAPGYLERSHGRGVLLMRCFMDDVQFNETGNQVSLVKRAASVAAN